MKIHISSRGFDPTIELEKYTNRKLLRLAKRVPRQLRAEAVCAVQFSQVRRKGKEFSTCSISFVFDGAELKAQESTLHLYAALDVAAVHMERQLIDYAAQHRRPLRTRLREFLKGEW